MRGLPVMGDARGDDDGEALRLRLVRSGISRRCRGIIASTVAGDAKTGRYRKFISRSEGTAVID